MVFFLLLSLMNLLELGNSDCINNLCYNFYVIGGLMQPKGDWTWFFLDIQECFDKPRYVLTVDGRGGDEGAVELYVQRDGYPTLTDYLYKCNFDPIDGEAQCALDDVKPGSYILGIYAKDAYEDMVVIFDTYSKDCDFYSGQNDLVPNPNHQTKSINIQRRLLQGGLLGGGDGGDGGILGGGNGGDNGYGAGEGGEGYGYGTGEGGEGGGTGARGKDGAEEVVAINYLPWKKLLAEKRDNIENKCYENSCKAMFEVGNIKIKKGVPVVITYNQAICHLDNTLTVLSVVGGQNNVNVYIKKCTECPVGPDNYDYRCIEDPENNQGKCSWIDLEPGRYFIGLFAKKDLTDLEVKVETTNPQCNVNHAIPYHFRNGPGNPITKSNPKNLPPAKKSGKTAKKPAKKAAKKAKKVKKVPPKKIKTPPKKKKVAPKKKGAKSSYNHYPYNPYPYNPYNPQNDERAEEEENEFNEISNIPTFENSKVFSNDQFYGILLMISIFINIYCCYYIYQLKKNKSPNNYQPIPTYT